MRRGTTSKVGGAIPPSGVGKRMIAQEAKSPIAVDKEISPQSWVGLKTDMGAEAHTEGDCPLAGKRMAVVSFSPFPGDPRPRRAAETFSQAGMDVEIICRREAGEQGRDVFHGMKIDRVAVKHERGSKFGYLFRYALFIGIAFIKLAARSFWRRYDIVHIHNMPDVLVLAAVVPKLLGAKVILDLHDPMPELMMAIFGLRKESRAVSTMILLEKRSIALADRVLTVNRACEKIFASRSCSPEKVTVIMNSPDESMFRLVPANSKEPCSAKTSAPFIIMYHGTLVERNGVDLAVEALAKVRETVPAAELHIYGPRTPFLDRVLNMVTEKRLEKAVQYMGARRLEQLGEAIAVCDVGVIPNKHSIFTEINTPTRIFEYLASGKPVIAPRAPGIQDYFNDDALIYFNLGDAEDLAVKLVWVATHPREACEITSRGQEVYLQHTWSREKEKLLKRAIDLLGGGRIRT